MIRALLVLLAGELRLQLRQPLSLALLIGLPAFLAIGTVGLTEALGAAGAVTAVQEQAGIEHPGAAGEQAGPTSTGKASAVYAPEPWPERLAHRSELRLVADPGEAHAELYRGKKGALLVHHEVSFDGLRAGRRLEAAVQAVLDEERADRLAAAGLTLPLDELVVVEPVDRATAADRSGASVGAILPFALMFALVLAGLVTALDLFTGEKERGTIETLLTTGVDRRAVALAKLGTVAVATWISGLLFLFSLAALQRLTGAEAVGGPIDWSVIAVMAGATVLLGAQVAGVSAVLGIYANDYKTASMLAAPVMLLVIAPAAVSAAPVHLDAGLALVPIANVALGARDLLGRGIGPGLATLVAVAALAHAALATVAVWKLLERETALIGGGAVGLEGRRSRTGQALAVYALAFVGLWFFGQTAQAIHLIGGSIFTQLLFAGIGVGAVAWLGLPLAETLSLRRPASRDLGLAVVAGLFAPSVGLLVFGLQSLVMPVPDSLTDALSVLNLDDYGLWAPLLFFALMPGVCEELLFRGAMLGLQRTGQRAVMAIALNAAAFGLVHVALHRWAPTGALGVVAAVAVWRTRSLWPAVVIHTLNNAIALGLGRMAGGEEPGEITAGFLGACALGSAVVFGALWGMGRSKTLSPQPPPGGSPG